MKVEIRIPSVGESVREALLAQWLKRDGDLVHKDEVLFVIETDKVTLEISAEADGTLRIKVPEGETVGIGTVVGEIDTEEKGARAPAGASDAGRAEAAEGVEEGGRAMREPKLEGRPSLPEMGQVTGPPAVGNGATEAPSAALSPSVRRLVAEKGLDPSNIKGTGPGGRITRGDVLDHLEAGSVAPRPQEAPQAVEPSKAPAAAPEAGPAPAAEEVTRKPMSPIRQKIAERLLDARQHTAMLTTFNEIDMSRVMALRAAFKDAFKEKYGISLGIMSFFIKASVIALQEFPEVNAFIEGRDVLYHRYYHIGVAVGSERGLVVPVIRHADRLGFAEIELAIAGYVKKIKENRLELRDLEGGTFTLSNGGVYGSLLSTPILNMPQSGILGMHKIEDRPVAMDGQVVIRPMMYVALSYDHRLIDGRGAVGFLRRVKECVENPERIMMEI